MATHFNIGIYADILRVRAAYPFEFALLIMRFFTFSYTIGTVTMLTLEGYPFFHAGTVASVLAIASLILGPIVSQAIDRHGQSKVLAIACLIVVSGSALIVLTLLFEAPFALLYVGAVLMGATPAPGALARTRWTYLIATDGEVGEAVDLRSVYAYEGVLDDLGFTLGPPISVAIATAIAPVAGMVATTAAYALGAFLLIRSKQTEPAVGWGIGEPDEKPEGASGLAGTKRSAFSISPLVRIVFAMMICVGAFFGIFDTATLALAEEVGQTGFASVFLTLSGILSMIGGLMFGMIKGAPPKATQLIWTAMLIGGSYACMAFVDSMFTLFLFGLIASVFYAPFLISENAAVESAVPPAHLTEAFTWINIGVSCGMAFGPTVAGFLLDEFGVGLAFSCGAIFALFVPLIALAFRKVVYRDVH